MTDEKSICILIVDDHPVVRRGLRTLIASESGMELVGEAADGVEAVSKVRSLQPDVILLDLVMPRQGGLEAIGEIKKENPDARILTRATHERNVEAIQRAGADFVLSYASFGAQSLFSIVRGRELVVLGEGVDLFYVPLPDSLAGLSLAEADIGARTGLNVIGVEQDGQIVTNLPPDHRLAKGSTLITLGSAEQRERFGTVYD